jgi:short-subunit dehydrogenase
MGQFSEIDQAQMEWLMNINFWGVVRTTRAFLPHLAQQREAHIVNLSSIFGIVAPPGQTAYAAAKFAVRGFSESLRHELQMAGSAIRLSVVHPGGVATNIARNSRTGSGMTDNARRVQAIERFEAVAKTTPHAAALRIIQGIAKNEPRILIGNDARFLDLLQRFRPASYWKVLARRIEKAAKAHRKLGALNFNVRHSGACEARALMRNCASENP